MACRERGAEPRLAPGPPPLPHKMAPLPRLAARPPPGVPCPRPREKEVSPGIAGALRPGRGATGVLRRAEEFVGAVLVLPQMRLELRGWAGAAVVCAGRGAAGVGEGNGSERGGLQELG